MVKVVLADDEEFVRYFLRTVTQMLSYEIVAEVDKGDELYSVLKKTNPDILLLDINMPNLTGMEFLKKYAQEFPKTCIIILTSASSFQVVTEASEEGASCYIRKDTPVELMVQKIQNTWSKFRMERR